MLKRLGFKVIGGLATVLPRQVQYSIAHRVADGHYLIDRRAREAVISNMRAIFGENAAESIIRREARWVFRNFGMYLCEFFGHRKFGPAFIDEHVMLHGRENLDAALAHGRGAIMCSAHYSNWELGAMVVAHLGYPMLGLAQMHTDAETNAMFIKQRAALSVPVVDSQHGAKAALRMLKRKEVVCIVGDRVGGGPIVPVTLCGRRTYLPQGPWRMSVMTGAPLLPSFIQRRFNKSYRMEIDPAIEIPSSGTRDEKIAIVAQRWTDCFEARLRADPCQWTVFSRVWDDPRSGAQGLSQSLALSQMSQIVAKRQGVGSATPVASSEFEESI